MGVRAADVDESALRTARLELRALRNSVAGARAGRADPAVSARRPEAPTAGASCRASARDPGAESARLDATAQAPTGSRSVGRARSSCVGDCDLAGGEPLAGRPTDSRLPARASVDPQRKRHASRGRAYDRRADGIHTTSAARRGGLPDGRHRVLCALAHRPGRERDGARVPAKRRRFMCHRRSRARRTLDARCDHPRKPATDTGPHAREREPVTVRGTVALLLVVSWRALRGRSVQRLSAR